MSQRVLVIEDNLEMCENIADILELANYDVLKANDGKSGVEKAIREKPDLIISDIAMPELDGYGVLHILSKDPATAGIPFVFLTARVDATDQRAGMVLGADDYITKPFNSSELLKVVELRIRKHELIRTSFETTHESNARDQTGNVSWFEHFLSNPHGVLGIKKKDFVFMEGSEPRDLYFVRSGVVKTYKATQDGKELVTGIHRPGQFIGYLPLLEHTVYNETAIALEDAELYVMPKSEFEHHIYLNREMAKQIIDVLASNLFEAEERLLEMAYQSVRQRVASTLIKLVETYGDEVNGHIKFTRRDLSGIIGTATESLSRTLADFRDEGLVELDDEGIKILNKVKLRMVAR